MLGSRLAHFIIRNYYYKSVENDKINNGKIFVENNKCNKFSISMSRLME